MDVDLLQRWRWQHVPANSMWGMRERKEPKLALRFGPYLPTWGRIAREAKLEGQKDLNIFKMF